MCIQTFSEKWSKGQKNWELNYSGINFWWIKDMSEKRKIRTGKALGLDEIQTDAQMLASESIDYFTLIEL